MIHGHLHTPDTYASLVQHPVWQTAFEWLRQMPAAPEKGIHPIRGDDMYVNVMEYATLPRSQCRFESHRKYLDLQYTITGAELIEWRLNTELATDGGYDDAKDLQFYHLSDALTRVHMLPGHFAIFFPSDAHLPKVSDGTNGSVFKLVIKINLNLLKQ
jgi:biofilm protein TabA